MRIRIGFASAIVLFICLLAVFTEATVVRKCQGKSHRQLSDNDVTISNCKKGRCRFKKNTKVSISMKITPDHDVKKLTTSVSAIVLNVPLPFVGVDGTSACNNMYLEDGATKTRCPLKAGQSYVYKNSFDILSVYPTIPALDVHWALSESSTKDLACFEVPGKISN